MQEGDGDDISVAVRVPVPTLDIPAEDVGAAGRAPSFSASLQGKVVPVDALEKLAPKLQPFYRAQNERIAFYAAVDKLLEAEEREGRAAGSQQGCPSPDRLAPTEEGAAAGSEGALGAQDAAARLAVSFSALANIVLLVIKLVAAASSGSMAVIASAVDSVLDLLSGLILYLSSTLSAYVDKANFPVGKSR